MSALALLYKLSVWYHVFHNMSVLGWDTLVTDSYITYGWAMCKETKMEYQYVIIESSQQKPGPHQLMLIHADAYSNMDYVLVWRYNFI